MEMSILCGDLSRSDLSNRCVCVCTHARARTRARAHTHLSLPIIFFMCLIWVVFYVKHWTWIKEGARDVWDAACLLRAWEVTRDDILVGVTGVHAPMGMLCKVAICEHQCAFRFHRYFYSGFVKTLHTVFNMGSKGKSARYLLLFEQPHAYCV